MKFFRIFNLFTVSLIYMNFAFTLTIPNLDYKYFLTFMHLDFCYLNFIINVGQSILMLIPNILKGCYYRYCIFNDFLTHTVSLEFLRIMSTVLLIGAWDSICWLFYDIYYQIYLAGKHDCAFFLYLISLAESFHTDDLCIAK